MPIPPPAKANRPTVGKLRLKDVVTLTLQSGVVLGACFLLHVWGVS